MVDNNMVKIRLRISIVTFSPNTEQLKSTILSASRAAHSLSAGTYALDTTIIVVNNCEDSAFPTDAIQHAVLDAGGFDIDLRTIEGHGNIGYGRGHNLAIDWSCDGYHLFLNPDVEINPRSIEAGIDYLEDHPEVGMASPQATDGNGRRQRLCKRYPTIFDLFLRGFMPEFIKRLFSARLARYEMRELGESRATAGIPIVGGCFMLCRNSVLAQIGGFDSKFFLYFEDFDLSVRLGRISDIAYLPDMKIIHFGGHTSRKGFKHIAFFVRSGIRFFSAHGWRWF